MKLTRMDRSSYRHRSCNCICEAFDNEADLRLVRLEIFGGGVADKIRACLPR